MVKFVNLLYAFFEQFNWLNKKAVLIFSGLIFVFFRRLEMNEWMAFDLFWRRKTEIKLKKPYKYKTITFAQYRWYFFKFSNYDWMAYEFFPGKYKKTWYIFYYPSFSAFVEKIKNTIFGFEWMDSQQIFRTKNKIRDLCLLPQKKILC